MIRSTLALGCAVMFFVPNVVTAQNTFAKGLTSVAESEAAPFEAPHHDEGAQDQPPADFFTGVYEMVGRDDYGALVDMRVKIEPSKNGALDLTSCDAKLRLTLTYENLHEGLGAFVSNADNPIDLLYCPFYTDGGNYPIFTCRGAEYTRLTLFPSPDYELEGCAPF